MPDMEWVDARVGVRDGIPELDIGRLASKGKVLWALRGVRPFYAIYT
jgi:hypothetical protein